MDSQSVHLSPNDVFAIDCPLWYPPADVPSASADVAGVSEFMDMFATMLRAENLDEWKDAANIRNDAEKLATNHIQKISVLEHSKFWFQSGRIFLHTHNMQSAFMSFRASIDHLRRHSAPDPASYVQILSKYAASCMYLGYYYDALDCYNRIQDILDAQTPLTFWRGDAASLRCNVLNQRSQCFLNLGMSYFANARTSIRTAVTLMQNWLERTLPRDGSYPPARILSDDGPLVLDYLSSIPFTNRAVWLDPTISWPKLYMPLVMNYVFTMLWLYLLDHPMAKLPQDEENLLRCNLWLQECADTFSEDVHYHSDYRRLAPTRHAIFHDIPRMYTLGIDVIDALCERDFLRHKGQIQLARDLYVKAVKTEKIVDPRQSEQGIQTPFVLSKFIVQMWEYRAKGNAASPAEIDTLYAAVEEEVHATESQKLKHRCARFLLLLGNIAWDRSDIDDARNRWNDAKLIFKTENNRNGHALRVAHVEQLLRKLNGPPPPWQLGPDATLDAPAT